MIKLLTAPVLLLVLLTAACSGDGGGAPDQATGPAVSVCDNSDGGLDGAAVFVTTPVSGARVSTGFSVEGCSRTFESTVNWALYDRTGTKLADGFTSGGGVDGPASLQFEVAYSVDALQLGRLEVFQPDVSGGEGFPPPRDVVPLVLLP